ncbi:MAG: hypothetical protein JXB88_14285 [Spirochaetales bacterium]|nr:hypothetical protein [Spirochaetales bacterium]
MDTLSGIFESCYNDIIVHNLPKAMESFCNALKEHPKHRPFLHGIIITYILLGELADLQSFLEAEKAVSPHRSFIESILIFLIDNKLITREPGNVFYNVALFVREHISATEARIYFRTGQVTEPSDQRYLIAMAEYYMIEGHYEKGLRLYSQAARLAGE